MGLFGPPNVEKMKAKKDVKGLIKALGYHKDIEIIAGHEFQHPLDVGPSAAKALGEIGDPQVIEPLISALKDESRYVRQNAASALGNIGNARAVEPLIATLKDKDDVPRLCAAVALGKISDARAVEPLIATLKDWHDGVRRCAAAALGKIGDARAIEPLIAALKDEKEYVRRDAAEALGKIDDPRAVSALEGYDARVAPDARAAEFLRVLKDPNEMLKALQGNSKDPVVGEMVRDLIQKKSERGK